MTRTRWSRPAVALFEMFFRPYMSSRLAGLRLAMPPGGIPDGRIILAANHTSWWDGFLLRELHRSGTASAPLFTLMLQSELNRFPFFRLMGVHGIDLEKAGDLRSFLRLIERAGTDHKNLWISFFPQGAIEPSWKRPLGFKRGLSLILKYMRPARVVPVAIHLETLDKPAPYAFVSMGEALEDSCAVEEVESRVTEQLDFLQAFLSEHGTAAPHRWPHSLVE